MRRTVWRLLSPDHDVVTAASVSEVLDILLAGRRFDAIVSDVWMPEVEGDGMHLDLRVRAFAASQADRILYMTAGGLPQRLARFIANRIVLAKPPDAKALAAAIEQVASRTSMVPSSAPQP